MIELSSLLWIGLGAGALLLAFGEYTVSYRKRIKADFVNLATKQETTHV
jgi:hypothetical protein